MIRMIGYVTLVVRDYDEAIRYFTDKLGFDLVQDAALGDGKRWVLVSPGGPIDTKLLLAQPTSAEQDQCIGKQAGSRVFLFLHTDDFWNDFNQMQSKGVEFEEEPRRESYGTVAVFRDLYGNRWDLLQLD